MNKKLLFTAIIILLLTTCGYLFFKYHPTAEGAFKELEEREAGDVIPLSDDRRALLIEENGDVSIAFSKVTPLLRWYEDFKVLPTSLNINDIKEPNQIPYVESPLGDSIHIGLIKKANVEYTISGLRKNLDFQQNTLSVFNLKEYRKGERAFNDVKLWWTTYPLDQQSQEDHFFFLDKNKKILEINKEAMKEK